MKFNKLLIAGMISASLLSSSAVYAGQSGMWGKKSSQCNYQQYMGKMKNLSSQQKQQIKEILKDTQKQMMPLKQQRNTLMQQIHTKLQAKGTTWQDVQPMVQKVGDVQQQIMQLKIQTALKIKQQTGVVPVPMKKGQNQ